MSNRKAINENDQPDEYERDLERDNRERSGADQPGSTMAGLADRGDAREAAGREPLVTGESGGPTNQQKDRTGQAQSPRELTHHEPPKQKEGH